MPFAPKADTSGKRRDWSDQVDSEQQQQQLLQQEAGSSTDSTRNTLAQPRDTSRAQRGWHSGKQGAFSITIASRSCPCEHAYSHNKLRRSHVLREIDTRLSVHSPSHPLTLRLRA